MTDRGPGLKASIARLPKPLADWLGRSVSLGTIVLVFAIVLVLGALYVVVGGVDVSADKPDGPLVGDGLHFVFKRSIGARSGGLTAPDDLDSPFRVRLAAQHYDMVCANCHGRPGFGQSVVALSMNPRPQDLAKVVGQFSDANLHQIVEHGVKYSAMPSWATGARGDEVWSMVAFLRVLPKLSPDAYRQMTALPQIAATASAGSGDGPLRPANPDRDTTPKDEFLYAAPSAGFADRSIHETPVATCARCHGADGSGAVTGGEAPNLTLQDAPYLQASLAAYTSGARKSGFMQTIAAELSASQIAALSHYYAGLGVKTVAPSRLDPALVARGAKIAAEGIPDLAIPACSDCHESAGARVSHAPHLAGQSQTYLRLELAAISRGGRGSTLWWNPMPAVAHNLGDQDIAAVAAYYAGLKPAGGLGGRIDPAAQATPPPSLSGGDLSVVKALFEKRCLSCHVNQARGDVEGNYPNLTLHDSTYTAQSLYDFRRGVWPNTEMRQAIDGLSLDQLGKLADYVNLLPPRPALSKPDADAAARGAGLAMRGDAARGVPACLSCHGETSVAALPLIPPLQGQNRAYLSRRLDNFAKRYDVNANALNPMPAIARRLTDEERADLAAYFAAARPLAKPAATR